MWLMSDLEAAAFHRGRCVHRGDGGDVIVNRLAPPVAGMPLSGINLPVYAGRW